MSAQPNGQTPGGDAVTALNHPECCGTFQFLIDGQRWRWSEAVARMHGYEPETVNPTTELLLRHTHLDDRARVAAVLNQVSQGSLFSSRHRIIDTAGHARTVVVVGDRLVDDTGTVIGTCGFYVDVTAELQSDVTTAILGVTASRAHIEQAKGVLMAAYGITAERAFEVLVWRSQQTNVKVRELAECFLAAIAGIAFFDTAHIDHALLNVQPKSSPRTPKRR